MLKDTVFFKVVASRRAAHPHSFSSLQQHVNPPRSQAAFTLFMHRFVYPDHTLALARNSERTLKHFGMCVHKMPRQ